MLESPNTKAHPLLNYDDFKDKAFEAGYDRAMGARLFSALASRANSLLTPTRNADSIAYCEENRDGQREVVVSVPNLSHNLRRLETVPQIGVIAIEATDKIIDVTMHS